MTKQSFLLRDDLKEQMDKKIKTFKCSSKFRVKSEPFYGLLFKVRTVQVRSLPNNEITLE